MSSQSHRRRPLRRLPYLPCVEQLENRDLPSTVYIVNTTADESAGVELPGAAMSLRRAILLANRTEDDVIIQFNIAAGGVDSVYTIAPFNSLPTITHTVWIDGTSQQTFNGGQVELSGLSMRESGNGLTVQAPNSTIQGLVINGFS